MAIKKLNENPKITDTILLEITTPDADDCFDSNPYKVDRVVIYYVERDFSGVNYGEYTTSAVSDKLKDQLKAAEKALCENPTLQNAAAVENIKSEIDSSAQKTTFYYKDRVAIKVIGSEGHPAWLSTDVDNSDLTLEEYDDDGLSQYGHFSYEWNPNGSIREGDYFLCWTWTPLSAGEKLSSHIHFTVEGDQGAVISIPTHETPADKYETLLERYLPEMYKYMLTDGDLTPDVTDKLNQAVSQGFTIIEDMANQIIDLFDANVLHESMLVYLSNLFSLKLKSNDPTLWRRQIKEAVPLFKRKGTLQGLQEAFSQAGMVLNSFTQYWQLTSAYVWTESFKVNDSATFELEKGDIVLPLNDDNFGLWLKREGESEYTSVTKDNVQFDIGEDGILRMTWVGDELSAASLSIYQGDRIKVMYEYHEIPGSTEQSLENYIRTLPLMDQRDEDDQEYPPKNWNVRLIAEDDPLFSVLVPVRHPFQNPLIFGFIRTEFAYSENIYNMEEYNGSTRPSSNPCHVDKTFVDPCGACLSSSYSVDIGVEELSNDRMIEAQEILSEFTPFHAQVHSINFTGEVNEFVQSPVEQIDTIITFDFVQHIISGQANPFFHRCMEGGLSNWIVTRDDLTEKTTVLSGKLGTGYNDHVAFISPDHSMGSLGVIPSSHILEVSSPSANAGTYELSDVDGHMAKVVSTVTEPVDQSAFTFNLSNVNYQSSSASITQKDLVKLSDEELDYHVIGVKTQWDVANTPDYSGGAWKVSIPAYSATPYEIIDIIDGVLVLDGDDTLPVVSTTGISYSLLDDEDNLVENSTSGDLDVQRQGYVNFNDYNIVELEELVRRGDYLYYDGTEYHISGLDGNNVWIDEYSDGDASGVTVQSRRRLIRDGVGYFGYRGLRLTTFADHEAEFEIVNGSNPPPEHQITDDSHFKENYMFRIGQEHYKIVSIDKKEVVLAGRDQNWLTQDAGGTAVAYAMVHFPKNEVNVGFTVFDHLDRDGHDPVIREVFSTVDQNTAVVALSTPGGIQENVSQEEGITFIIENKDGETTEGEI